MATYATQYLLLSSNSTSWPIITGAISFSSLLFHIFYISGAIQWQQVSNTTLFKLLGDSAIRTSVGFAFLVGLPRMLLAGGCAFLGVGLGLSPPRQPKSLESRSFACCSRTAASPTIACWPIFSLQAFFKKAFTGQQQHAGACGSDRDELGGLSRSPTTREGARARVRHTRVTRVVLLSLS